MGWNPRSPSSVPPSQRCPSYLFEIPRPRWYPFQDLISQFPWVKSHFAQTLVLPNHQARLLLFSLFPELFAPTKMCHMFTFCSIASFAKEISPLLSIAPVSEEADFYAKSPLQHHRSSIEHFFLAVSRRWPLPSPCALYTLLLFIHVFIILW